MALVRATPKAHRELARIRRDRNVYLARRLASLEPEEVETVLRALPALEKILLEDDR